MTSHKYLSKKKGAAYTFFSGLRTALVPAAIIAVVEFLVFTVSTALMFYSEKQEIGPLSTKKVSDTVKFITSAADTDILAYFTLAAVGILSVFVTVVLLRFMADKRTVNVYYSLGIKRRSLFFARWFSGAVMLTVPPIIAVVGGFIVNLAYVGLSWQLSVVYIHLFFGLWLFSLLCYSVSAAVFASVGTVSEGVLYSVGILAFPSVVLYSLQNLLAAFIPSATFNTTIHSFGDSLHMTDNAAQSLVSEFSRYNPLLFFANEIMRYSVGSISNGAVMLRNSEFRFPNFGVSLFWIPVIVVAVVVGCIMFVRRNAENCGFLNTNKVLSNAVLFELLIFAVSLPLVESAFYPLANLFLAGAVSAFVVYILYEVFLKRNAKLILKASYKFVAHAAVIAIIIATFSSGLFGYASYVPSLSDVSVAAVSVPSSGAVLDVRNGMYVSTMFSENPFTLLSSSYGFSELPEMTDENDISNVVKMHEKLVKDNADSDNSVASVTFRYVLKNGKKVSRKVFVKDNALLKETVTEMYSTNAVKAQISKLLSTDWSTLINESGKYEDYTDAAYGALVYGDSEVSFVTPTLNEIYRFELTKDEFGALKDAVKKDLLNLSAADMLNCSLKSYGVLSFESASGVDSVEGMTVPVSPASPDDSENPDEISPDEESPDAQSPDDGTQMPDDTDGDDAEEKSRVHRYEEAVSRVFPESSQSYSVVVSEKMTETVAVLKKAGLGEVFTSKLTPKSVSFVKIARSSLRSRYYTNSNENIMCDVDAYTVNRNEIYDYTTGETTDIATAKKLWTENNITDAKKVSDVMSKLSLYSIVSDGDYICVVDYGDDICACYPLAAADAPDFVTNYEYKVSFVG